MRKIAIYKLPLGIRIPQDNEYPKGYDIKSINKKRSLANIVEGYVVKDISGEKFSDYLEVNVDADKLWDVFCSLVNKLFVYFAYGIIGFKGEKPRLSRFTKPESLLKILEEYKIELVNDGYIEFGIAFYNENTLNEIFVSNFKYMKIWTTKKDLILENLCRFDLEEVENLEFIDGFPVISEALSEDKIKGVRHYSVVIQNIEGEFEKL